jgi:lipopolysaccharide assembly protein A
MLSGESTVQLIWIASLFFAVLIALFAVQNPLPVSVNFLFWRVEAVAVSALVLAAAALGALLTYLFGVTRVIRSRVQLRGNRSTIREQESLIADLRSRIRELEHDLESSKSKEAEWASTGAAKQHLEGEAASSPASPHPPLPPSPRPASPDSGPQTPGARE